MVGFYEHWSDYMRCGQGDYTTSNKQARSMEIQNRSFFRLRIRHRAEFAMLTVDARR
ncbi:hypothetical protein M413DRAFT_448117 [Hebeloma cylindrosporum]|uniref:Uncharacterized protein n=1 Tax=Hebeloma cylindrosporum TaxID=76867 RepID=A0A0C2Y9X3_HEBCY|nr:hypothetical protein M413DRAFT_448117 [Hebeloma cylindrosporum h7]